MAITVTGDEMTSTLTTREAKRDPGALPGQPAWQVTWLPDRWLDYCEATTAMVLAETVATRCPAQGDRWWPLIVSWAGELGLTAEDAVVAIEDTGNPG